MSWKLSMATFSLSFCPPSFLSCESGITAPHTHANNRSHTHTHWIWENPRSSQHTSLFLAKPEASRAHLRRTHPPRGWMPDWAVIPDLAREQHPASKLLETRSFKWIIQLWAFGFKIPGIVSNLYDGTAFLRHLVMRDQQNAWDGRK